MRLYLPSEQIWPKLLAACAEAKESILFEQYLIEDDAVGKEVARVLIEKAKQGVKVRCLFDSAGSFTFGRSSTLKEMETAGIHIEFFNWLWPFSPRNLGSWYFRNHRRQLIIDSKQAFTGGICFGEEAQKWIDSEIEITSPSVVLQMQELFITSWHRARRETYPPFKYRRTGPDEKEYLAPSSPLLRKRFLYYELIRSIRRARRYAYFATPYFLPDNKLKRTLIRAARRGVDVKILVPRHSNHSIVNRGSHTYYDELLFGGVKIYWHPEMLHSKTAVIDDAWTTVGSLNLDNLSLRYNFEANVINIDRDFAISAKVQFEDELAKAEEIVLEKWRRRAFISQWLELLVWPIRKFL